MCSRNQTLSADHSAMPSVHVCTSCICCAYSECKARVHFMRSLRLFRMQSTCALHAFLALDQNAKHMCTSIQYAKHVCTSCVPCAYSKCKAHVHFNSVCKARVHFNCVPCASSVCVLIQYANRFYSTNSTVPVLQYRFYIAMYQKSLPYVHALFPPPPRNVN